MTEGANAYFPLFLRLAGERVLVVGGGTVAARKLALLRDRGARLEVVAATLGDEVAAEVGAGRVDHRATAFAAEQVAGCRLVIAATDDEALNHAVADACRVHGVPVNVVDDAEASTWISPAIVARGPIQIAISTAGASPVLARRLRERLETELPAAYGEIARFMAGQRERVAKAVPAVQRRRVWEDFLDGPGPERLLAGDEAAAAIELDSLLRGLTPRGEVYLVGAGPGDPDLLTFRALRLMQQCDVVLHDRLIAPPILDLVRRDAERMFVGKARSRHAVPQEEINAELVRRAQAGQRVLRLKGGDPFIFGRGGEEIETLAAHGIPFQVVPGITAASGCAAYAGIPLTHRDHAQSCIFVTGHARADGELALNWAQLTQPNQTVVVYMGLHTLPDLCRRFVEHGLPPDWPAALVAEGTSRGQQVITGTLADLPAAVAREAIEGAALVIVGTVVTLREKLRWFGSGRRR